MPFTLAFSPSLPTEIPLAVAILLTGEFDWQTDSGRYEGIIASCEAAMKLSEVEAICQHATQQSDVHNALSLAVGAALRLGPPQVHATGKLVLSKTVFTIEDDPNSGVTFSCPQRTRKVAVVPLAVLVGELCSSMLQATGSEASLSFDWTTLQAPGSLKATAEGVSLSHPEDWPRDVIHFWRLDGFEEMTYRPHLREAVADALNALGAAEEEPPDTLCARGLQSIDVRHAIQLASSPLDWILASLNEYYGKPNGVDGERGGRTPAMRHAEAELIRTVVEGYVPSQMHEHVAIDLNVSEWAHKLDIDLPAS